MYRCIFEVIEEIVDTDLGTTDAVVFGDLMVVEWCCRGRIERQAGKYLRRVLE